jgi:hypothetical protein
MTRGDQGLTVATAARVRERGRRGCGGRGGWGRGGGGGMIQIILSIGFE